MKALTVLQPWAWAIMHAGKDVENRTWKPGKALAVGELFAIHAGKKLWTPRHLARDRIAQSGGIVVPRDLPRGVVLGVCQFHGCEPSTSRWAEPGMVHWNIAVVYRCGTPIAARGKQMLWYLPKKIESHLLERCGVA